MEIAIIGAGVGGLTLALHLHHLGINDVKLYESSSQVSELGVGINILPHAMKALDKVGLLKHLLAESVETSELQYLTKHGQLVWKEPRGKAAGYNWPQISIHRGSLVKILYSAVLDRLGENSIVTNQRLLHFDQKPHLKVTAVFESDKKEFDCLIGCDGIHSNVRKTLYPYEGAPKWGGITMWRGVSYMNPFLDGNPMVIAGPSESRIVFYPITQKPESDGKVLINWVAKYKTSEAQLMPKQDWIHEVNPEEIPDTFKHFTFLKYPELLAQAEAIYKYPQVDRDPLPSWHFGNVTLLGDAAHPMYPSGSNGASQAILDAVSLSKHISQKPSIDHAFKAYDAERRPATEKIVLSNRKAGPERCIDIVEQRAPEGFHQLTDIVSQTELSGILSSYKKIAGFDVNTLNQNKETQAEFS